MLQSIILTFVDGRRPKSVSATGGRRRIRPLVGMPPPESPSGRYLYNPLRSASAAAGHRTPTPTDAEPVRATTRNRREPIGGEVDNFPTPRLTAKVLSTLRGIALRARLADFLERRAIPWLRTWVVEISPSGLSQQYSLRRVRHRRGDWVPCMGAIHRARRLGG